MNPSIVLSGSAGTGTESTRTGAQRPRILAVCGYVPNPITLRKIDALHRTGRFDVHLAFWRSRLSPNQYPFSTELPPDAIHPVDLDVSERDDDGALRRVVRGNVRLARFYRRLTRIIRTVRPDLIHASNSHMLICGWLASVGRAERALVYDLLDTDDGMRSWPVIQVQRLMHRRVDQFSVPSPRFVTDFLRPLRLIPADCEPTVIANAPWASTFDGIAAREADSFVVGCIGSLRCQPALEWLVESVGELRSQGTPIEILFAGNGVARPYVERASGQHAFVRFLVLYDYASDIRSLYEQIDASFAVYEESWDKRTHLACRLSDAIASNRAIIVAAGTYMAELVNQHRLGYVVDLADRRSLPDALADAVRHRDRWRDPARIPAGLRAEHTLDSYLPALSALYEKAIQKRKRNGEMG